jgi:hypothetical protein
MFQSLHGIPKAVQNRERISHPFNGNVKKAESLDKIPEQLF